MCGSPFNIIGTVTPHNATPRVILQRTYGGKWKDVPAEGQITTAPAKVNQSTGRYTMQVTEWWWSAAMHLRVRSNDGTSVSPDYYQPIDPNESC